jgi:hypothetical protein
MVTLNVPISVQSRCTFAHALWKAGRWGKWVSAGWLFVGICLAVRDEIIMPKDLDKWRIGRMIPHLPLSWLVIALCIVVAWLFEGSFRLSRMGANEQKITSLQSEALSLAKRFQDFLGQLGPFPEFDGEFGYGSVEGTASADVQWRDKMREWETRATKVYQFKFAAKVNDLIFRFGEIDVTEPHLEKLLSEPLPREEFLRIPEFLRMLVMWSMAKSEEI